MSDASDEYSFTTVIKYLPPGLARATFNKNTCGKVKGQCNTKSKN